MNSERLDHRLVREMPELSRSSIEKLIESGQVTIDKKVITKPAYKVTEAATVKVSYSPGSQVPKSINLPIVYEDKSCVVIDKPTGLLTHSKGAFNPEPTVATWLRSKVKGLTGERAGIVHRLDRGTSGVMICAKNQEALSWLQKQFSQRKVKKTYLAVVQGQLERQEAMIDMPIERNPKKPQTFRVGMSGKSAVTTYKVLKTANNRSLVELLPLTGRTHQLRVHLTKLGHPIVGDTLYGGPAAGRLYLHAAKLELTLPNKERKLFEVAPSTEFYEALK